ncbi:hypothetical protein ACMX25_04130 [Caballeronia sp. 15715]|uniref:hypothetical protein n=1 Tax=Caballeronia sp. 15715 TaxID=3391030 RepID=UPI0039E44DAB
MNSYHVTCRELEIQRRSRRGVSRYRVSRTSFFWFKDLRASLCGLVDADRSPEFAETKANDSSITRHQRSLLISLRERKATFKTGSAKAIGHTAMAFNALLARVAELGCPCWRFWKRNAGAGEVRRSANSIGVAFRQIAAGNPDLSQHTDEQAASLEQTAARMGELTATVRQNAENARPATTSAIPHRKSCYAAGRGVVGRVVETMHRISGSSTNTGEIISVIKAIAYLLILQFRIPTTVD